MKRAVTAKTLFEEYSMYSLLLLLLVILFTAGSVDASLASVIIGFTPALITVVGAFFVFEEAEYGRYLAWVLPFVLIPAFYLAWSLDTPLTNQLSAPDLIGINLFIAILYLAVYEVVMTWSGKEKTNHPHPSTVLEEDDFAYEDSEEDVVEDGEESVVEVDDAPEHTYEPRVPETNYNRAVLIGEKCKSLNYAIGQVYDRSSGAVKDIRNSLHINREAYNGLVDYYEAQEEGGESITTNTALGYLNTIVEGVQSLSQTEEEVFGELHKALKKIERAEDGSDTVIDVLATNSRSPVYAAKQTLLSTCKAVARDLKSKTE
jgi:hypothetical protein